MHLLIRMIKDIKRYLGSIYFIFTKYDKSEAESLRNSIKDLLAKEIVKEFPDEGLSMVVEDLLNKT